MISLFFNVVIKHERQSRVSSRAEGPLFTVPGDEAGEQGPGIRSAPDVQGAPPRAFFRASVSSSGVGRGGCFCLLWGCLGPALAACSPGWSDGENQHFSPRTLSPGRRRTRKRSAPTANTLTGPRVHLCGNQTQITFFCILINSAIQSSSYTYGFPEGRGGRLQASFISVCVRA